MSATIPFIPSSAPFTAEQRAWLNGYFVGPLSSAHGQEKAPAPETKPAEPLLIGYGIVLTPALYIPNGTGLFSTIVRWNPMSPLIKSAREAATAVAVSEPFALMSVLGGAVALTALGVALIRVSVPIIVERMLLGGR